MPEEVHTFDSQVPSNNVELVYEVVDCANGRIGRTRRTAATELVIQESRYDPRRTNTQDSSGLIRGAFLDHRALSATETATCCASHRAPGAKCDPALSRRRTPGTRLPRLEYQPRFSLLLRQPGDLRSSPASYPESPSRFDQRQTRIHSWCCSAFSCLIFPRKQMNANDRPAGVTFH